MRVQVCPKCGGPMNVAFALYKSDLRKVLIQCPRCHITTDEESGTVETIFLPEEPMEYHAGAEGIEARVSI